MQPFRKLHLALRSTAYLLCKGAVGSVAVSMPVPEIDNSSAIEV